jgi:hypothetical protein
MLQRQGFIPISRVLCEIARFLRVKDARSTCHSSSPGVNRHPTDPTEGAAGLVLVFKQKTLSTKAKMADFVIALHRRDVTV